MNCQAVKLNLEDFKEHMLNFNKYGYTVLSLILGHDLGLFDLLNDAILPLTVSEISEQADLKERYVKEWLGAVTAANIISVKTDKGVNKYRLQKEYFDILNANVALSKGICECVKRLGDIEACFKKQGPMGDPAAFDGDFWKFFGQFRDESLLTNQVQKELFPKLETEEKLHNLLDSGCDVLDVGCGTGALTMEFGKHYPNSFFTGIDTVEESIRDAKAMLEKYELESQNITFQSRSTTDLIKKCEKQYDVIMMSQVLHNLPDPLKTMKEVKRLLKPAGKLLLIEMRLHSNHVDNVGNMGAALQYSFSQFFCLPFSMSETPHEGFGMGWGEENLLTHLKQLFTLDARFDFEDFESLFILSRSDV